MASTTASPAPQSRTSVIEGVTNADLAATILRISTGILFLAHAWLKLVIFTPAGTVGVFRKPGLPRVPRLPGNCGRTLRGHCAAARCGDPMGVSGAGARIAGLDLCATRRGRLLLLERRRRVGVSRVLGRGAGRPGLAGQWRLRPPAQERLTPAGRGRYPWPSASFE